VTVFGNVSVAGVSVISGGATPVPVRVTFCGELTALSATLSVAVSTPAAAGLKLTEIVQLAPAASVDPQVVVSVKELASVPVKAMPPLAMTRVAEPVFLSVTSCGALVDPCVVLAKVKLPGVIVAVVGGAAPIPVSVTF
jgi:hypothetical protein